MLTFEQYRKVFSCETKGKFCIEIHFLVKGMPQFQSCWMGLEPDRDHPGTDCFWFGLKEDGTAAYNFASFAEFASASVFDGRSLEDICPMIELIEVDGCDPEQRIACYLNGTPAVWAKE